MAVKRAVDKILYAAVIALLTFGLVMVYSATTALPRPEAEGLVRNVFALKQGIAALLGLVALSVMSRTDYRFLRREAVTYGLLASTLVLLVATLFYPALDSTRRWLFLGGVSLQPGEIAKLTLVIFLATQANRYGERAVAAKPTEARALSGLLLRACFATGPIAALVLLEGHFGTALLLVINAILLLFFAGVPGRLFALSLASALPALWLMVASVPYRRARMFAFLDLELDPLGSGFQALQSLIAVGSGGLLGLGPGQSVQKYFLPQPHSDFLYAIVAEELGLIGALAVMSLYLVVLWRGLRAGWRAPDLFGRLLAWSLTSMLIFQAFVHMSVTVALLPTAGIPLPLLSYGGTSLVMSLTACGILLNISSND